MSRTLLFFSGDNGSTGAEPTVTDGTAAGTGTLADILPGTSGSSPFSFTPTGGGGVVFGGNDGSAGVTGLFVTDGTPGGTVELKKDFASVPTNLARFFYYAPTLRNITPLGGGRTLFTGATGTAATELFVTDGTFAGTRSFAAFGPSYNVSVSDTSSLGNGRAVFNVSSNATLPGFWSTDGTGPGTVRLSATARTVVSVSDGAALFTAADGNGGTLLGITDGTLAGTATLRDFASVGGTSGTLGSFQALGNGRTVFSLAAGGTGGNQLWVTDGTASGTSLLATQPVTASDPNGLDPGTVTLLAPGRALFAANNGANGRSRSALWTTDGTASGTTLVGDLAPTGGSSSYLSTILPLGNGKAVVRLNNYAANTVTVFGTDGTAGSVVPLIFLSNPGYASSLTGGVLPNGQAVLGTTDAGGQLYLYLTDGTAAGTGQFTRLPQNSNFGPPNFSVLPDGRAVFTLTDGKGGQVLWATSGTAASTGPIGAYTLYGTPVVATVRDANPLFDSDLYLARNPDVAASVFSAPQHYEQSGWREGRDPDAFFSTAGYLNFYRDVRGAGVNPLTHYDASGWREGRDPSAAFDTNLYLLFNPDVKAAGIDPLAHWLVQGQAEGRKMSAVVDGGKVRDLFDPTFYGLSNPDVAAAGLDLGTHFATAGAKEGRDPDAFFDVKGYLARNPDVAASGINPVAHYLNVGWKEGRDPSTHFSTTRYLAAYADVRAAGINPLQHFLASGIIEGRSGFGDRT